MQQKLQDSSIKIPNTVSAKKKEHTETSVTQMKELPQSTPGKSVTGTSLKEETFMAARKDTNLVETALGFDLKKKSLL